MVLGRAEDTLAPKMSRARSFEPSSTTKCARGHAGLDFAVTFGQVLGRVAGSHWGLRAEPEPRVRIRIPGSVKEV